MKQVSTKAIMLRRVNYEEADRILTAITPDHGKLSLFAKGARRAKSKLAGGLELFSVSDIVFIDGKRDLKTVVSTRLDRHFDRVVTAGVDTTMLAYDFLKLIDENTQDECDPSFYYLLEHALEALQRDDDRQLVRSWFYVQLMQHSGRGIMLDQQITGAPFLEETRYAFDFDEMGFAAHASGQFQPKHIKFLRLLAKVDAPANILRVSGADEMAGDMASLLEQVAKYI